MNLRDNLEAFRYGAEPVIELPPDPSWRQLYSKRIWLAGLLGGLQAAAKALESVDEIPLHERAEASRRILEPFKASFPVAEELFGVLACSEFESTARLDMALFRLAVGVAWFEAEEGKPPARLEDLVPRHVPAISPCPYTGRPFEYEPGKVRSRVNEKARGSPFQTLDDESATWTVRRK
jgi:hypothetical protein